MEKKSLDITYEEFEYQVKYGFQQSFCSPRFSDIEIARKWRDELESEQEVTEVTIIEIDDNNIIRPIE